MNILARLLDYIFVPRESELLLRSLSNDAMSAYFNPQVLELEELSVTTLTRYEEPAVRAAIIEAKYHGNAHATQLLGQLLSEYLVEELVEWHSFEHRSTVLIPIPLSHARRAFRGYNQTEVIARYAFTSLPNGTLLSPDLLIRARDTLPQTTLSGELRRKNMHGAFTAPQSLDPSIPYILLDDVVTTGSTLAAAAEALRARGARHILPLALAH